MCIRDSCSDSGTLKSGWRCCRIGDEPCALYPCQLSTIQGLSLIHIQMCIRDSNYDAYEEPVEIRSLEEGAVVAISVAVITGVYVNQDVYKRQGQRGSPGDGAKSDR